MNSTQTFENMNVEYESIQALIDLLLAANDGDVVRAGMRNVCAEIRRHPEFRTREYKAGLEFIIKLARICRMMNVEASCEYILGRYEFV